MKQTLLLAFLLVLISGAQAQTFTGGEITYEHAGNASQPNLYKLKLYLYRTYKPGVVNYDTTTSININSTCYGSDTLILKRIAPTPLEAAGDGGFAIQRAYNCIDTADTNTIHISVHKYEDTITLPGKCADFRFSYTGCCRDTNFSNFQRNLADTLFLDVWLNNTRRPNNSVLFNNDPLVNVCLSKPVRMDYQCTDVDGDSLVYDIWRPQTDQNTWMNWAVGYSGNNPVQNSGGFGLNIRTGIVEFQPAIVESDILMVKVEEWSYDTILQLYYLVGMVKRESRLNIVSSCSNPSLSPLFNSDANNIDTSAKFYCNDKIIKLKLNYEIQVDKIAKDGSNFRLVNAKNNSPIPIIEAGALNPVYSGLYTKEVWVKTFVPITRNDTFDLSIKPGLLGTKLITSCEHEFTSGTVRLVVDDCQPVFGIYENEVKQEVMAYPNPVGDILNIEVPQGSFEGTVTITIFDLAGKQMETFQIDPINSNTLNINCEHFGPGVYLVQLNQPNQKPHVIKIIKE